MADTTWAVKVPEDLKAQIQQLVDQSGLQAKDFMKSLINVYQVEKSKEAMPEIAEDLKELQVLTQRINNIYLNIGHRVENIVKSIEAEKMGELQKKDSLLNTLYNKNEEVKTALEEVTVKYEELVNQNNDYLSQVNQLTKTIESQENTIALLNEKSNNLASAIATYQAHEQEYQENLKLLQNVQGELDKSNKLLSEREASIGQLQTSKEDIDRQHSQEVKKLEESQQIAIINLREKLEIEKEKALLELERKHRKEIEDMSQRYGKRIDELQQTITANNERFQQLLRELREKQDSQGEQVETESAE